MRNKRQIKGELRDYTYKSTHISAVNRPKEEHLIPNYRCFDTALLHNGQICILLLFIVININENLALRVKLQIIKGYNYKASHISAAYCPTVGNMVPN